MTCNDILIIPAHKAAEDTENYEDPASNDENESEPVYAPITGLVKENIKSLTHGFLWIVCNFCEGTEIVAGHCRSLFIKFETVICDDIFIWLF